MHTLVVINPGHFHAALTFREAHPSLSDNVYVYSAGGPELDQFSAIVESYNQRDTRPTRWNLHVYTGDDYLEKAILDKKGNIGILAGKNHTKMEQIAALSAAGFSILSDKPLITTHETLPFLQETLAPERPLAMDIMTERYEITTALQRELITAKEVFGDVRVDDDGSPSVYTESVHFLYKTVNEKPLVRPLWYFDVDIQGEGIMDTTTHLVDMIPWMLFPGESIDYAADIDLTAARRWPTRVPLEIFSRITGSAQFPDNLRGDVHDEVLDYFCNGELKYTVKGVPVHVVNIWDLEIAPGGCDTHCSLIKGTRSDLCVRQLPEKGLKTEVVVKPRKDREAVHGALQAYLVKLSDRYPGLSLVWEENAIVVNIPEPLRTTHEQHHAMVRDAYLDFLDHGTAPPESRANLLSRYTLLAEARKLALACPFERME